MKCCTRSNGIGGAHNAYEFFKNDVQIMSSTPHTKTIYNPQIISDGAYINRGIEAANAAYSKSSNGTLSREWVGTDSQGVRWCGYFEDGEIKSFFPE